MEKIKQFLISDNGKDMLIVLIVILVGLGSFELGRLSKENTSSGLKIEYTDQNSLKSTSQAPGAILGFSGTNSTNSTFGKNFFASSKGSKYYTLSCSGGKTIKQENRVYFETGDEAEAAGYALSTSCN